MSVATPRSATLKSTTLRSTTLRRSSKLATSLLASLVCIGISGCQRAATVRDGPNPQPVIKESTATTGLETIRAGTTLRRQATRETDAGEYQRASRLLERALRVDSRDPATYYELARLRCLEAANDRAQQMIEKGLTLKPDASLRSKFGQLRSTCTTTAKTPINKS